jgi:aminoglycoside-2''-adenylyltransferase
MGTIQLPHEFSDLLRLLNRHEVRYLIIGGFAVAWHGYPRATGDIDIWVGQAPANAPRIVRALKEFGFDVPGLDEKVFQSPRKVVRMGFPPMRVELFTTIPGVAFDTCYRERVETELGGVSTNIISLRHLRKNKKATGRSRDLDDLRNLPG